MARRQLFYLFGILVFFALFCHASVDTYAQATGQIRGKVTAVGGQALQDIGVDVYWQLPENPIAWSKVASVTTNANGNYTASSLAAGTYRLFFFSPNNQYLAEYYNNGEYLGEAIDITLAAGATVSGINVALAPAATIKGIVTDRNGAPLADIRANIMRAGIIVPFYSVSTGLDGSFTISGIYTGTYNLYFDERAYRAYAPEYYNNVQNIADATPISVTAGQTVQGINVQLDSFGIVTGTVTGPEGMPLSTAIVAVDRKLEGEGALQFDRELSIGVNPNGSYSVFLPEGVYRIRFGEFYSEYAAEYYNDVYNPAAATLITVTNNALITDINAQLGQGGAVSGRVTDHLGQPLGGINIRAAYDSDLAPNSGEWVDAQPSTGTDENGDYTLCCLDPIPHRIFFDVRGSFLYLPEYYPNAHDETTATPVPVTVGGTTPNIDAQFESYAAISGWIADRQDPGISDILVTLYQPSLSNPNGWTVVASTQPEIMFGHYGFGRLTPGQYRLGYTDLYSPTRYISQFYDNASSLESATTISLTYNMSQTINVKMASNTSITGTLTDAIGDPLANIYVAALDASNPVEIGELPVSGGLSDANGHYSLEGLFGGDYIVVFSDAWLLVALANPNEYMFEYYDNAQDVASATILSVPTGTHRQNIDAQLNPRPRIQGKVTDNQGNPLDGITIEFQRYQADNQSWQTQSSTNSGNGAYSSALLPNGLYRVRFAGNNPAYKPEYYNNTYYPDLVTTLAITTGKAYARIDAALEPAAFNAQPWAQPDAITAPAGQTTVTTGKFPSLLANDQDAEGAALSALVAVPPTHGTLTLNTDGHFTYRHSGDSAATDRFTYRAGDGVTQSDPATVTITISPTAAALASFVFSKTVSIEGITPTCTPVDEIKVPLATTIVYCYTVRNTGPITLTTHALADSHLGQLLNNVTYQLAPGAQYATTFTQTLTVNTTNVATWTATAAAGQARLNMPTTTTARKAATVLISGPNDDQDGDTIPDNLERAGDLDNDNLPNFLDTDADGDDVPDQAEAGADPRNPADSDNDGVPDYLDSGTQPTTVHKLYLPLIRK